MSKSIPAARQAPFLLLAVIWILLYGQIGCVNHHAGGDESGSTPALRPICSLASIETLDGSLGLGPIRAERLGEDVAILMRGGTVDRPDLSLLYLVIGPDLTPRATPSTIDDHEVPILPEALAIRDQIVLAVGRDRSGRSAQIYSGGLDRPFVRMEASGYRSLDRRVSVRLASSRGDGPVQLVAHLSGTDRVELGPVTDGAVDTHPVDIPSILVGPEIAWAGEDALALLTVERSEAGEQVVVLREVDGQAVPLGSHILHTLEPGVRIQRLHLAEAADRYWVGWERVESDSNQVVVESALVERSEWVVRDLEPITGTGGLVSHPRDFAARWIGDGWLVLWVHYDGGGSLLKARLVDSQGSTRGEMTLRDQRGEVLDSLQIVELGDRTAVFTRDRPINADYGVVSGAVLSCSRMPF